MRICRLLSSLLLSGCAAVPESVTVHVPVPVSCIEVVPVRPSLLSDAQLLALDDYALVLSLAHDRRVRQGYQAELEAVIAGCR